MTNDALLEVRNLRTYFNTDRGLFRAQIELPAVAPTGKYEAEVWLFQDGQPVSATELELTVEKVGIVVEDAPLHAIDFDATGSGADQVLTFHTRTEDEVVAGPDNPIRVDRDALTGEPSPYVHVRRGLWARIDRKSFYRLIDLGSHETVDGQGWFGLWSSGRFFPVIPSADL